jgi:hypothetical protein
MIQALMLAAVLSLQDPKPAKTVEDRIRELSERIAVLDKKATDLTAENHELQRKIAAQNQVRDSIARASSEAWIKRFGITLSLTEPQTARIQELWQTWTREDFAKRADVATWKTREETFRNVLTPEQGTLLEKKVRAEQELQARSIFTLVAKEVGIEPAKVDAFASVVMSHLTIDTKGLLPLANPNAGSPPNRIREAIEASLPDLASRLSEEELLRLRKRFQEGTPARKEK